MSFFLGFLAGSSFGFFSGVFLVALMVEAGKRRREKELEEDYIKMGRGGTD